MPKNEEKIQFVLFQAFNYKSKHSTFTDSSRIIDINIPVIVHSIKKDRLTSDYYCNFDVFVKKIPR